MPLFSGGPILPYMDHLSFCVSSHGGLTRCGYCGLGAIEDIGESVGGMSRGSISNGHLTAPRYPTQSSDELGRSSASSLFSVWRRRNGEKEKREEMKNWRSSVASQSDRSAVDRPA